MSDLDRQVAFVQGWEGRIRKDGGFYWHKENGEYTGLLLSHYTPSTNWQQAGELLEKYGIGISPHIICSRKDYQENEILQWVASSTRRNTIRVYKIAQGSTPQEAICKAVIELHKGDNHE